MASDEQSLNYWVIGAVILVLAAFQAIAYRRRWMQAFVFAMILEVQARAARDRQLAKDQRSRD